jgi:hypothetical protein
VEDIASHLLAETHGEKVGHPFLILPLQRLPLFIMKTANQDQKSYQQIEKRESKFCLDDDQ